MVNDLDPISWYSNRELEHTPVHFVMATTELTEESKLWILNNLRGRFSIVKPPTSKLAGDVFAFLDFNNGVPAFEDSKEATMYELKWS